MIKFHINNLPSVLQSYLDDGEMTLDQVEEELSSQPTFQVGDRVQTKYPKKVLRQIGFKSNLHGVVAPEINLGEKPLEGPSDYDGGYWYTAVLWDGQTQVCNEFSDILKPEG